MGAVLMDTHSLFWLLNGEHLAPEARIAIADAQDSNEMYVSAVTAWEAALAVRKRTHQPNLGGLDAADWFRAVLGVPGCRLIGLPRRIAFEAASVPTVSEWNDPFDCLLIATARIKNIPIITRDTKIIRLSKRKPHYLKTIEC